MVLFDLLVNNADRKGSHVLIEKGTRKLWVIDHGLCFHEEEKLRTVLWDAAGHAIPAELAGQPGAVPVSAGGRSAAAPGSAPVPQLTAEIEAMLQARRTTCCATGIFPSAAEAPARFPYPPI